jgi:hypothetical protein
MPEDAHPAQLAGPHAGQSTPEWFDLKTLARYGCVSERTLREWIKAVVNPLPASRRGNKLYVRRRDYDAWMEAHRVTVDNSLVISRAVDDIVRDVTGRAEAA